MNFTELNIDPKILQAINQMGFEEMSPIQEQAIPLALEGKDLIGQAQTGTGKTAAFGIPLLNALDIDQSHVQALVIAPTRELAIQTQEELYRLGKEKNARTLAVYGGAQIGKQINNLKNKHPHVVVGTPGRLLDHLRRGTLKLDRLQTLVLDEADEMLDMGFIEDIETIIQATPSNRQTMMFSATMEPEIKKIADRMMKDYEVVQIKAKTLSSENITQYFTRAKEGEKFDYLTRFLDVQSPSSAIVFGRTKRRVDELTRALKVRGYSATGLHGDLQQNQRNQVMNEFKNKEAEILVATDVAARGLDISDVTHVYNYDIPQDPESYVHRIGRTGRAGRKGMSITFVTPNEMSYLRTIEDLTKQSMAPLAPPTEHEALEGQVDELIANVQEIIQTDDLSHFKETAERLLEDTAPDLVVAALIKALVNDQSDIPVQITPERPLPRRGGKSSGRGKRGRKQSHSRSRDNRGSRSKKRKRK